MSGFDDLGFQEHADQGFDDLGFTPHQQEQGLGERFARGALRTLPVVGGIVGGVIGTPADIIAGPMGTVAGAGLGAAAGKSLQNIGERMLGDDKTRSEIYTDPILAARDAAMWEMGGQMIGQIPNVVKSGINSGKELIASKLGQDIKYTPVENKQAIEEAAHNLGLSDVPKGVLTDNPTFQKLESGLSQSGSLPAKQVREQYNEFFKGLDKATEKVSSLKSPDSDFALGSNIQKELANQVNSMRAPVSEMYQDLVPHFQKIPVDQRVVNSTFGALKRNPLFQTAEGKAMLNEYRSIAMSQPELNSLKEWRSTLGDSLSGTSSPLDAKRIDVIREAVTKIRDNSINAMKGDLPKEMHGEVDDLINQIALADKAHATNISDINSVKSLVGNKDFSSPTGFLNKLSEAKESDLAQRASNLDITSLRNMQDKFPQIFEKAKTAKINEMIQSSTSPVSGFNEARFLKQYDAMDKELKDLIFTPEMKMHIDSLKTIRQAIPPKLGPSGTPEGQMMMDMFNPKRNALDFGIKKTLEGVEREIPESVDRAVPNNVLPFNRPSPIMQSIPGSLQSPAPIRQMPIPRAADQNQGATNFNDSMGKDAILAKTQNSKYAQIMQNAAQNGDQSVAAAHYVLQTRDPEYRKVIGERDE